LLVFFFFFPFLQFSWLENQLTYLHHRWPLSPPKPLFFTGNLTLTQTKNPSFSNPKPRQFHSLDMPWFKPRIQLVWTIIIPKNTTKTLLSPCLILSSIMDLCLSFSSGLCLIRIHERGKRISMEKENELCDNNYLLCFNIYRSIIIIILLIFKIYFDTGCKV